MIIPRRHNQDAVNRYARVIQLINDNYPKAILIDPQPLALETFRARLRDAVNGVAHWGMKHPIGREALLTWCTSYTVSEYDGKLLIGSKEQIKAYSGVQKTVGLSVDVDVNLADDSAISEPDREVVSALLLLQDQGYLEDLKFQLGMQQTLVTIIKEKEFDLQLHTSDTHVFVF